MLINKEMQIKTTVRYHLTLVKRAIIRKSNKQQLERVWRKGNPLTVWECTLVEPVWETLWRFLSKLKVELPYDSVILLLGIHLENTVIQEDTCIPLFPAALFSIARTWK